MTTVFIINGKPRSGKDTFIRFMQDALRERGIATGSFSSIDPVRKALKYLKIDVSAKTEADRLLLSVIGDAVETHSQYRTAACVEAVRKFAFANRDEGVFFLHIREPKNIEKVITALRKDGHGVTRIEVISKQSITAFNPSDMGTDDMEYDYRVDNGGSLGMLYDEVILTLAHYGLI